MWWKELNKRLGGENVFGFIPLIGGGLPVSALVLLTTLKKTTIWYMLKGCSILMIVHKQTQRVSVLELSTLLCSHDNSEDSSDETAEAPSTTTHSHHTNENNTTSTSPDLYTISPHCDDNIRHARMVAIKDQIAKKQYHVDPYSLAQAIYREQTKRHREN
jgi:anti-sigma28 factor (negative regulator of flagellin synthesis)